MNVTIRYVGTDFWGRAVFQGDNGRFYKTADILDPDGGFSKAPLEEQGKRTNLSKVNLSEVNLYEANLSEANLYEANLYKAGLRGAKNIVTFGPIGSRGDFTYAVRHTDRIMVKCGCFWGDFEHWQAKCRAIHKDTPHGRAYAAAADFIRAYAAAYWQD